MNKGTLDTHLEMLMPIEMQHDIGCNAKEPYAHREVSQRVMRIINRCVDQAAEIKWLRDRIDNLVKTVERLSADAIKKGQNNEWT